MSEALITLTSKAAKHIAEILQCHKDGIGFRLSVKETGCSGYMYVPNIVSEEAEDDIRVDTKQGITIFLDYRYVPMLSGTEIDLVEEDLGQKKLIYKNPNVEGECGCGESFKLRESK